MLSVERDDEVITVDVEVAHPGLGAADLTVDVWVHPVGAAAYPVAAHRTDADTAVVCGAIYRARLAASGLEGADVAARALPHVEDAPGRFLPGLIAWSPNAQYASTPA